MLTRFRVSDERIEYRTMIDKPILDVWFAPWRTQIAPVLCIVATGQPDIEYRFVDHVRYLDAVPSLTRNLVSIRHSARLGPRCISLAARRLEFIVGLLLWSSSGQCLRGRIFRAIGT